MNTKTKSVKVRTKSSVSRISKTKALQLIEGVSGRFFGVVYIKKDNTKRMMNCRYKGKLKTSPLGYITVIDVAKQRKGSKDFYRKINLQTIKSLTVSGKVYKITS